MGSGSFVASLNVKRPHVSDRKPPAALAPILDTVEACHERETRFPHTPDFVPAGRPGQFFVVSEDITSERALEGASMFLGTAVSLGSDSDALDDGARWAMVHFVEMAKALVDTVVNAQMENGRE